MDGGLAHRCGEFVEAQRRRSHQAVFEGQRRGTESVQLLAGVLDGEMAAGQGRGALRVREAAEQLLSAAEGPQPLEPAAVKALLDCGHGLALRAAPASELGCMAAALLSLACIKQEGALDARDWAGCVEALHHLFTAQPLPLQHIELLFNVLQAQPSALSATDRRLFANALSAEEVLLDRRSSVWVVRCLHRLDDFPAERAYARQFASLARRMARQPAAHPRLYPLFKALGWLVCFHSAAQPETAALDDTALRALVEAEPLCSGDEGFFLLFLSLLNAHPAHLAALQRAPGLQFGFGLAAAAIEWRCAPAVLLEAVLFAQNVFRATGESAFDAARLAALRTDALFGAEQLQTELARLAALQRA